MIRDYKSSYLRDYSGDVYEKLVHQIKEINYQTTNPISDFFGDIGYFILKYTGIINVENPDKYRKEILDMNNVSLVKLIKIFEDVGKVENKYVNNFREINKRQQVYLEKICMLSEKIHPNFSIDNAESIRIACEKLNKRIVSSDKIIYKQYEKELNISLDDTSQDAAKGTLGGIISITYSIYYELIKDMNDGKGFKATWDFIGSIFSFAENDFSLGICLLVSLLSFFGVDLNTIEYLIEFSEERAGCEDLADALEAEGSSEIASIVRDIDDLIDSISTLIDFYDDGKDLLSGKKVQNVDTVVDASWEELSDVERNMENAKLIKKIYKYAESVFDANEEGGIFRSINNKMLDEVKLLKYIKEIFADSDKYEVLKKYLLILKM